MVERVNKLLRFFGGHEPDVNALSAHLDGRLATPEAARLRAHLASCEACRARLDGLRATRDTLRAMLDVEPPRSFRLRAADVERAQEPAAKTSAPMLRWAPAVSAVAAVVFAIVIGVDLSSSRGGSSYSADRAPLAARQADTASSTESGGMMDKNIASAPVPQGSGEAATGSADGDARGFAPDPDIATAAPGAVLAPAPAPSGTAVAAQPPPSGATATPAARAAIRPVATATSELQATSGEAAANNGGNNTTALRVMEIVAAAIAVLSAAAAVTLWRTGRERL